MEQQEYIIQLSMIQQEAQKLEEKMHIIDEQMLDMQSIRKSLDDIDSKAEGDEILSNLGKGIFMKTNIKEKNLLVNVGKNIVVETSFGTISGKAVDIDENGFLILDNGKKINAGDVVHLR